MVRQPCSTQCGTGSRKPAGTENNRGVEGNRVRHMDYGVQINKLMYTRLLKGEDITLFSPSDVPGLYDALFADQDEFERLYTKYEKTTASVNSA